jgi:hypothetical protein
MIDIDGKPFARALVGVVTLATGYVAEVTDWALLALPLSVMVGHYLAFRSPAEPATPGRRAPVQRPSLSRPHMGLAAFLRPPVPFPPRFIRTGRRPSRCLSHKMLDQLARAALGGPAPFRANR